MTDQEITKTPRLLELITNDFCLTAEVADDNNLDTIISLGDAWGVAEAGLTWTQMTALYEWLKQRIEQ